MNTLEPAIVKGFVHADFSFTGKLYFGNEEQTQELKGTYYYNNSGMIIKAFFVGVPGNFIFLELMQKT